MKLLERQGFLDRLASLLVEAGSDGQGRLVLVAGEAGIGKSALVDAFCNDRAGELSILWGSCDPIVPARPFAPLVDIADTAAGLQAALESGERDRVLEMFLRLLRDARPVPPLLVFEDLHWADEATLDLLRVVGRRLRASRCFSSGRTETTTSAASTRSAWRLVTCPPVASPSFASLLCRSVPSQT